MDNLTNFTGMRLVIDPKDNEFYLFAQSDSGPGMIHGKIEGGAFHYNVKRGSGDDGAFTGKLLVEKFPFELTKYSDAKIQHLLTANDESKSQIKKEQDPMDTKLVFEHFDPELFDAGKVIQPPKTLSRKHKKKWYGECKAYRESKGKQDVGDIKEPVEPNVADSSGPATILPIVDNNSADDSNSDGALAPAAQLPEVPKERIKQKVAETDPFCGANNTYCLVKDHPEGYVIAHYSKGQEIFFVLGTPPIPDPHDQDRRMYFITTKEKTAESLMQILKQHPGYKPFLTDAARECSVHPVTNIPVKHWNTEALLVVDIYSLMNSKLFD